MADGLGPVTDSALAWECSLLLAYEARLLEERRFEEWLDLFTDDCLYWVPTHAQKGPQEQVAVAYEDRRRLTDRVTWLRSAHLHAQSPPSRVIRHIAGVEAWLVEGQRIVKSTLILSEIRDSAVRQWPARVEHRWNLVSGTWRIQRKTVLLLEHDKPLPNIAFAF